MTRKKYCPFDTIKAGGAMHRVDGSSTPPLHPNDAKFAIDQALAYSSGFDHRLWDPFSGNGTITTTAAIMFPDYFSQITASDANNIALAMTRRNLQRVDLVSLEGQINARNIPWNDPAHYHLPYKIDDLHKLLSQIGLNESPITFDTHKLNALNKNHGSR